MYETLYIGTLENNVDFIKADFCRLLETENISEKLMRK